MGHASIKTTRTPSIQDTHSMTIACAQTKSMSEDSSLTEGPLHPLPSSDVFEAGIPHPSSEFVLEFAGSLSSHPVPVVFLVGGVGSSHPFPVLAGAASLPVSVPELLLLPCAGCGVGDLLANIEASGVFPPSLSVTFAAAAAALAGLLVVRPFSGDKRKAGSLLVLCGRWTIFGSTCVVSRRNLSAKTPLRREGCVSQLCIPFILVCNTTVHAYFVC